MTFRVLDAGNVLQTITKCRVLDAGTLRNLIRMKVMDSDNTTLRTVATFATPLTLSISPASLFAQGFSNVLTTDPATATPSGGLGPYTYSWAIISGVGSAYPPTSATTAFTSGSLTQGVPEGATARCTCTDSSGQTATADITAVFYFPA